ncbi:MAG: hypothetical protein G01um101438_691 [Parcubacteria group bacterium Gr01-1014_38]|nr:MAG: hypothetical protein G01um101438_691 [Parcubacteria group bacterium Gr01-1014_38]
MAPRSLPQKLERYQLATIPLPTLRLLEQLAEASWIRTWYLAGGTALALHYAHRSSEDLDFFTEQRSFRGQLLAERLPSVAPWQATLQRKGTLYGRLGGVKISFIAYPWFRPAHVERAGYLRILGPDDIAVMKMIAVAQRGRRRDFVDLYTYCRRGHALGTLLERVRRQYPDRTPDIAHLLRSHVFFDDAEKDPPVRLVEPVAWRTITAFFEREVSALGKKYFGL